MSQRTILLTVDALRSDHFSQTYFEECWQVFSNEFSIFTNTHSHGTATPIAFPGLIGGQPSSKDGSLPESVPTIAELHTGGCIGRPNNPHLNSSKGYERGFDIFGGESEAAETTFSEIKSAAAQSEFITKLYNTVQNYVGNSTSSCPYVRAETLSDKIIEDVESDSAFVWGHYMDPHTPHTQATLPNQDLPESDEFYQKLSEDFHDFDVSEDEIDVLRDLYEKHVRYLDKHLNRVLSHLKAQEWWDDTLVIFVGDHGEAFGEEGQLVHPWDDDPIDTVTHVPLAVKFPGKEGNEKYEHTVQHSDVYTEVACHTDSSVHSGGKRLRDKSERIVISKSNSSIRALSDTGRLIIRRDGSKDEIGTVTAEMRQAVESEPFPEIPLLSGETLGVEQENGLDKQLEALGYK